MASIRPHNAGWQVRYRDPSGRSRGPVFRRKSDATAFAATVETDMRRGKWIDLALGKKRFGAFAHEWLATTVHLKPSTQAFYESVYRNHVSPFFNDFPLA